MENNNKSGTYVFDKKTGKIIKVSEDIPSLNKPHNHTCSGGCCCSGCHHNED